MPKGDNHTVSMHYDPERMTKTALDCALKDYLSVFGHERYVARLQHALDAHQAAEKIRRG